MAKVKEKEKKKTAESGYRFPLTRTNFLIIALGVLVIVLGYIFMAIPDDPDAFMTRTLAPIMLVFAYLIIIPVGLFYREKKEQS
jgi:cytochrome bd-type quinol oxidase subunit 2